MPKNAIFGKNGQHLRFRGPKGIKQPITPKILYSWKNACPNFFPVGSKEKEMPTKDFWYNP